MRNYQKIFNSKKPFRAICIGDSTTAQDWCHPNWIDWLNFTFRETDNWQEDWRRKFINCGRDGGTIKHYLEHFDTEVSLFKPHLVIISIGLNSLIPTLTPSKYKNDLITLTKKIISLCKDVVIWSPYAIANSNYHKDLKTISDINKKVSEKFNLIFIDMFKEFLRYNLRKIFTHKIPGGNKLWGIKNNNLDYLHCNEVGNQIIAEQISKIAFKDRLSDWEYGTMRLLDLDNYLK